MQFQSKVSPKNDVLPKLEIGATDDIYEKEADNMADKVMRMTDDGNRMQMTQNSNESSILMNTDHLNSSIVMNPIIQRQEECGKCDEDGTCEECKKKIQKSEESSNGSSYASPQLNHNLESTKGRGSSLPDKTKDELGKKMNEDFGDVKIHTDSTSVQMNKEIGAKAFTHGTDIYFNQNQFAPQTNEGKHLLAHELTHTIQQKNGISRKIQRTPATPQPYENDCSGEWNGLGYVALGMRLIEQWKPGNANQETLTNEYILPYIKSHGEKFYAKSQPGERPNFSPYPGENEQYNNWENPRYWDKCCSRILGHHIDEISFKSGGQTDWKANNENPEYTTRSKVVPDANDPNKFDLVLMVPAPNKLKEMDLSQPDNGNPWDGNQYFWKITLNCEFLGKNCDLDIGQVVEYGAGNYYYPPDFTYAFDLPMQGFKTPYDLLFEEVMGTRTKQYNSPQNPDNRITQENGGLDWIGTKENYFVDQTDKMTLNTKDTEEDAFEALVKHLYSIVHKNDLLDIYIKYYSMIAETKNTEKMEAMMEPFAKEIEFFSYKARLAWIESLVMVNKASEKQKIEFDNWKQGEQEFETTKQTLDTKLKNKKIDKEKYDKKINQAENMRIKGGYESEEGWTTSIKENADNFFMALANQVKFYQDSNNKIPFPDYPFLASSPDGTKIWNAILERKKETE